MLPQALRECGDCIAVSCSDGVRRETRTIRGQRGREAKKWGWWWNDERLDGPLSGGRGYLEDRMIEEGGWGLGQRLVARGQ